MLYEIGVIILFLSDAFCGGSPLVPVTIAAVGMVLMFVGRRADNGKYTDTER